MIEDEQKQLCHPEVAEPRQYGSKHELSATAKEVPEARQHRSKRAAFTLAEVLITLGIIGIVAAMTIPALMRNYQERVFVTRLKQTYSIFSQAYLMAVNENGDIEGWDLNPANESDGAQKLYNYFSPHLKRLKDCNQQSGCFASHYEALFNNSYIWQPSTGTWYARGILSNGVSFLMWSGGSGCNTYHDGDLRYCGTIKVDLNGNAKPNKAGVDYFNFYITNKGLAVQNYKTANFQGEICEYNNESRYNGLQCSGYVLSHGNMDYLRRDISQD